jgi:hypothetical protein
MTSTTPMTSLRKKALVAGIFYVVTFISIPTLGMYSQVKNHTGDFILGSGSQNAVLFGCLLEVIVALAGIGTAVTLYPVIKRQNESAALGFVTLRVLEAAMIFTGVLSLVSIVTLRQTAAGSSPADVAALVTTAASHVATYKTTMLLGQTLMPAINGVLLGTLMYRSRLVPRIIPVMGLIGGPLLASAVVATLLGHNSPSSAWSALATLPIAAWEFSLGVRLIVKGFSPSPIISGDAPAIAAEKELIPV